MPDSIAAFQSEQMAICTEANATMQRLADAAGGGYTHYVHGQIEAGKLAGLLGKFVSRYPGLTRNRKHAYRQKLAGLPRHKLIAFYRRGGTCGFWLVTDKPDQQEQWLDITGKSRPVFLLYELKRTTKAGTDAPVWTWHIAREAMLELEHFIRDSIRCPSRARLEALQAWIDGTRFWAGFSGIRADRSKLIAFCSGEWTRSRPASAPRPVWPPLRYLRRIKTR